MKLPKKIEVEHSLTRSIFGGALASYILSSLAHGIGPLVDGAVIGNFLGLDAVAAYGMMWPAFLICALFGAVIAGGTRNLYTSLVGQGKTDEANSVFTVAHVLNYILSTGIVLAVWIFPDTIAELLGAKGTAAHLKPLISGYLRGYSLGVPLMNASKIISSFMSVDSDAPRTVRATVWMTVTDVIGDLMVVFLLQGSMLGIGLATSVSNLIQFTVLSLHFLRKKRILRYSFRNLSRYFGSVKAIIVNGAPSGTTRIASAIAGIIINYILVSNATSEYIAAYSVQKSVIALVNCVYLGVADTVWTLSSVYYGEEDRNALYALQRNAFRIGENISILVGIILLVFAKFFARIYLNAESELALNLSVEAIRVFACTMPFNVLAYTFINYLVGTKHLTAANVYGYILECGFLAPVVWILVILMGGRGVWHGNLFSLVLVVLSEAVFILRQPHGKDFNEKRLMIRNGFGTDAGRELSISAGTMEEIIGMSRLSGLFCRENGISDKQAFYLSLCVEEMAMNILNHGYKNKKGAHVTPEINIRFLIKDDDGVILRIRDNGIPFNPVERYEMVQKMPADPTRNLGIRIVMNMSRDVNYYNINKTNNLIIRV